MDLEGSGIGWRQGVLMMESTKKSTFSLEPESHPTLMWGCFSWMPNFNHYHEFNGCFITKDPSSIHLKTVD